MFLFCFFRSKFSSIVKLGRKKRKRERENSGRIDRDGVMSGNWAVSQREKQRKTQVYTWESGWIPSNLN